MAARPRTAPALRREAGLRRLAGLLARLRGLETLREGRPGTFRLGGRAFLHFHYHPDGGIVADVRLSGNDFTRFDVSSEAGQDALLAAVRRHLEVADA